jgi:hypothetical protein
MDELQRLVNLYGMRADSSANSKLDVLIDLERVRDPRVVPFLVQVLADPRETANVRIHVVKQLRNASGIVGPAERPAVAGALVDLLADTSSEEVRLQAVLALADFTHVAGVLPPLTAVALAQHESIDLRYAAFTSIERAGATPEVIASLREISRDGTMGNAARTVLSAWHVV